MQSSALKFQLQCWNPMCEGQTGRREEIGRSQDHTLQDYFLQVDPAGNLGFTSFAWRRHFMFKPEQCNLKCENSP